MGEPRKKVLRRKRIRLQDVLYTSNSSSDSEASLPQTDLVNTVNVSETIETAGSSIPQSWQTQQRPPRSRSDWVPRRCQVRDTTSVEGVETSVQEDEAPQNEQLETASSVDDTAPVEVDTDNRSTCSSAVNSDGTESVPEHDGGVYDEPRVEDAPRIEEPEHVHIHDDTEDSDEDTRNWTLTDATRHLYSVKIRHNISDRAFEASWKAFREVLPVLQGVPQHALPSARTIKRQALRDLPDFRLEVAHLHTESGEEIVETNLEKFPYKKYEDRSVWKPIYEVWRAKLDDVLDFHKAQHNTAVTQEVVLNVDGVPIGRTGRTQIIVSLKFVDCRSVYQLVNAIPAADCKKRLTVPFLLETVLRDLERLELSVKLISADAPMRAFLRNQKSHSGKMACDYCYGIARHEKKPVWGLKTINQEPRTMQRLLQDYEEHDLHGRPLEDFGYRGKCELMDLMPGWDFINGIPVDPMHLLFLGLGRCLFELLFHVGESRVVNDKRTKREKTDGLDSDLTRQKVPSEIARRPRPVDFKNWKASEWRCLVLYMFPLVILRLPKGLRRQMWLEFSYLSRAYTLPEEDFVNLDTDMLNKLAVKWYRNYHHLFGSNNMRYNVHLFLHLSRIRVHGPFSKISAFPFEGSFAASSRAQKAGTLSEGLQSMRASYLRPMEGHTCEKTLKFRCEATPRTDDSLIFTHRSLYKICDTPQEVGSLVVNKIITTTYFPPVNSKLNFDGVGVKKYLYVDEVKEAIRREDVKGKVIAVDTGEEIVLVNVSNAELQEAD